MRGSGGVAFDPREDVEIALLRQEGTDADAENGLGPRSKRRGGGLPASRKLLAVAGVAAFGLVLCLVFLPGLVSQLRTKEHAGLGSAGFAEDIPCASTGAQCSQDTECCSYACVGGTCAKSHYDVDCQELGTTCNHDSQCCSYHCRRNDPSDAEGRCEACAENGHACRTHEECCSFNCKEGQCKEYSFDEDCVKNGEKCATNEDCCGFWCHEGTCAACKEHGDQCSENGDCCSYLCMEGRCEYHEEYDYEGYGTGMDYYGDEGGDHDAAHDAAADVAGDGTTGDQKDGNSDGGAGGKQQQQQPEEFVESPTYGGVKHGYVWRTGSRGVGYYPAHEGDLRHRKPPVDEKKKETKEADQSSS